MVAGKAVSRWSQEEGAFSGVVTPTVYPRFKFEKGCLVFTIGSCFARNMEEHLKIAGFSVPVLEFSVPPEEYAGRPAGVLNKYNAPTILQELDRAARSLASPADFNAIARESLISVGDGKVVDLELSGSPPPATEERAFERRAEILRLFQRAFDSDVVVITPGLVETWIDQETGLTICDWGGAPAIRHLRDRFRFKMLSHDDCYEAMEKSVRLLLGTGRPEKKIVLTVSPVPLNSSFSGADARLANTYSKSVLRAVAQKLYDTFEAIDYFPSYEMVILSERSCVWEKDNIHVRSDFVGKIAKLMLDTYSSAVG